MVGIVVGIARNAAPIPVSLRNTLTRKRPPSLDTYEKSRSWPSRRTLSCDWVKTSVMYASSSASPRSRNLIGIRSPCMRSMGGTPTARCRSEQPWATPNLRNASTLAITRKATRKQLVFRVFGPLFGHKREVRQLVAWRTEGRQAARLEEFLEGQAQFVHALGPFGLVQGHALHDQAVQFRGQVFVDLDGLARLALDVLIHHGHVIAARVGRHAGEHLVHDDAQT